MTNSIEETQRLGQSIWYDNIRRSLLTSGSWSGSSVWGSLASPPTPPSLRRPLPAAPTTMSR